MAANHHLHVNEPVKFGRNILQPGRVIHTSSPEHYIAEYGGKVSLWDNWPEPFQAVAATAQSKKDDTTAAPTKGKKSKK